MPESHDDTIAAVATASGRGAIGIVRMSGAAAASIARGACGRLPRERQASLRTVRDAQGEPIDSGLLLRFDAPHSYTGEDVIEFQGHGGVVVLHMVLARFLELGARRARPGEFTQRAFLGGRMDLTQAEAVADLIDAGSVQAARAARRALVGQFSRRVEALGRGLIELRVALEGALDFPEDVGDEAFEATLDDACSSLLAQFDATIDAARSGRRLRDAVNVVIVGAPNAGKSSLMNRLCGVDRAIVTDTPGTTRDAILEPVTLAGVAMQLCDTAGLRESGDAIEREGMRRTRERVAAADVVIQVLDVTTPAACSVELPALASGARLLKVRNKIDRSAFAGGLRDGGFDVSALTGDGLDVLCGALVDAVSQLQPEGEFTARQRHLDALGAARSALCAARELVIQGAGSELVAEELASAQGELDELTGKVTRDDLLGHIFATFCIGK